MFSEANAKAGVTFPKGFQAAGVKAGIKKSGNLDVAVIYTEKKAVVAGTFTKNAVVAAPVHVSKEVVATHTAHAIVANAGCANACTGAQGEADAAAMQRIAADALGCSAQDVIVGSTGIIGQLLPMDKVEQGIHAAVKNLSVDGSVDAGNAIITTDTYSKAGATSVMIGGKEVRFGIIAKGSGMIRPDMATVLCFITTDADIDGMLLQEALSEVIEHSLNMISIDGDMSTNDMAIVLANGAAGNPKITEKNADYEAFKETLLALCQGISEKIAADGEGATKFITVHVKGAKSFTDAKTVGMSVANSPLVKTAFFGEDPNWGRVICAVGYAGVPMDPNHTTVQFGGIPVYADGVGVSYDEDALRAVMTAHDIVVEVDLKDGDSEAKVWTCDFSYEYVKINGEYHT
ncbi:bifunctional glutamate N-acetyltransferase/amino-acid acetyltransferase ArgJ [Selenomonas massiliensis]|uniref:bifunctional glutamate N-acetyltransferase/amino-acid acetyltransferase ArgJ n=1 Tax=Selenomonas massiliensis TaxID=2058293 RepID=UPI000D0FAFAD|nr:bifunctional glutamate N-acetyltransferase/amino-acid acetyltransferase ArgJ [Selenomonas massiliensis]